MIERLVSETELADIVDSSFNDGQLFIMDQIIRFLTQDENDTKELIRLFNELYRKTDK